MEKVVLEFDVDSKGAVTSVNKVNDALEDTGKTGKKELNTLQDWRKNPSEWNQ